MEPQEYDEFLSWRPELPLELLGKGLLHAKQKLILYGPRKTFKSMLVCYLLHCWRYGVDFLDIPVPPMGVTALYLQLELSHELLHERMDEMHKHFAGRHLDPRPLHIWTEQMLKLDGQGTGIGRIAKYLEKWHPDVLILDPLYKLLSASINDQLAMTHLFDQLDVLADKYGCAIVIIAHPRKPQPGSNSGRFDSDDLMGQSLFSAWADTVIQLNRVKGDDSDDRLLTFEATRYAKEELDPLEIHFNRASMQFTTTTGILRV